VLKEDEVRHERILKGILRRVKRIPHSYIEKKVKELGSLSPMIPSEGSDTLGEILEKMINFEKSMRDLYRMLENVEDEAITYAFEILADDFRSMIHSILADEEDHIQLLRSLIEPRFF
jgi:rubrerythrin